MNKKNLSLLEDFYVEYLATINDAKFTKREIDVIACILHGRTAKGSATLLSIFPKTVQVHIQNVRNKLDVSSREGIINFIESSGKLQPIRDYYSKLLVECAFDKKLDEISKLKLKGSRKVLIIYGAKVRDKRTFFKKLEENLEKASLKASVVKYEADQTNDNEKGVSSQTHIMFAEEEVKNNSSDTFPNRECIDLSTCQSYYAVVFEILKRLHPSSEIEKINRTFKEEDSEGKISFPSKVDQSSPELLPFSSEERRSKKRNALLWGLSAALYFLAIGIFFVTFSQTGKEIDQIRSDLLIPVESAFLNRPTLINQIDQNLKMQSGIRTVVLIGIGGAGKTTLARYYARQQNSPIVWEINAEMKETAAESFESLAHALAKTDQQKELLRKIKGVGDFKSRNIELLLFVKKQLKTAPGWVLIYDNVENFSDIQEYFAQDPQVWGKGRVLVTTRNSGFKQNNQMEIAIHVNELNRKETLNLFSKLTSNKIKDNLIKNKIRETSSFLDNLPPFPLDISVAAYTLNNIEISYEEYLDRLHNSHQDFSVIQENILKDATEYKKTRYGMLSLIIKALTEVHKDFGDLLSFIGLLDSQEIPRELLNHYKSKMIVDQFIHQLKKHSLIIEASYTSNYERGTFSIHRSTQDIIKDYQQDLRDKSSNEACEARMAKSLQTLMRNTLEKKDEQGMKIYSRHAKSFLNKKLSQNKNIFLALNFNLGWIFKHLGQINEALKYFEKSKNTAEAVYGTHHVKMADILLQIGECFCLLLSPEIAHNYQRQALSIYRNHYQKHHYLIAKAMGQLGITCMELGKYREARKYLETSHQILKKQLSSSWVTTWTSQLYNIFGYYEKIILLEESILPLLIEKYGTNNFFCSWSYILLGIAYSNQGQHEKALLMLEQAVHIQEQFFGQQHFRTYWGLYNLGEAYRREGNYVKAELYLKKSFTIAKKTKYALDQSSSLQALGDLYLAQNVLHKAKDMFFKSLILLKPKQHTLLYKSFEGLSDVYAQEAHRLQAQGKYSQANTLQKQASQYLKQALEIITLEFPKDSPHIARIRAKLEHYRNI